MKKIFLLLLTLLTTATLWAQAPQRISYQSIIRDGSNVVVSNTTVGIKISVIRGTATGTAVYVETHRKSTNVNGLLSLEIGDGTAISGTFTGIDWANGPYLIKTETDPTGGTNYSIPGIAALNSVPYALFSANGTPGPQGATGPQGSIGLTGATGAVGLQGAKGDLGATGPIGPAGANGTNGATGAAGTNGTNGLDGKTVLNGTVDPTNEGVIGDFYINTATSTLFGPKASGGWPTGVSFAGAAGIQGIQGAAGANGTNGATGAAGTNGTNGLDGKTVLNGTSNPATGQGVIGDFYINTATSTLFGPKASGGWLTGVSLVGAAGIQGIQGVPGVVGPAPSGTGIVTVDSGTLRTPSGLTGDVTTTGAELATTIATGAVTSNKILDGTIATADLANSAVTDEKIAGVAGSKVTGNITGNAANVTGTVAVGNGGTGQTTELGILTALGFKSDKVAIGNEAGLTNQSTSSIAIGGGSGRTNQGAGAIGIGYVSGDVNQGLSSIAIGPNAAQAGQKNQAIAIGYAAGQNNQGQDAVAIGTFAGQSGQAANSIAINATGTNSPLNPANAGFYVDPIRTTAATTNFLFYNLTSREVTTSSGNGIFVDLTSAQTIAGAKTFSSDITINGVRVGRGLGNNDQNVAVGADALASGTGTRNTAVGFGAMRQYSGTSFDNNTSIGYFNLPSLTSGSGNTSVGAESMMANITGTENTSVGNQSLINSTGNDNVGIGKRSGQTITSGSQNTIIGTNADVFSASLSNSTALGFGANVAASNSIQLGNANVTNVKTSGTLTAGSITYPNVSGTNGQVLTTNGSGIASWATPTFSLNTTVLSTVTIDWSALNNYDVSNVTVIFVRPNSSWTNIYGLQGGVLGQMIHIYTVNNQTGNPSTGLSLYDYEIIPNNNGIQKFVAPGGINIDSNRNTTLIFDGSHWRVTRSQ